MSGGEQSHLTDSPWFWILIFSGMALVALVAMQPKYGGRQARLERQYQARERIEAERAANSAGEGVRIDDQEAPEQREFATAEDTLIPLWPLAVLLLLVLISSALMLRREHSRSRKPVDSSLEGGS